MTDISPSTYEGARPACEVPDCERPVWGSEAVCRPHLLRGVTAANLAARAQFIADQAAATPDDKSKTKTGSPAVTTQEVPTDG